MRLAYRLLVGGRVRTGGNLAQNAPGFVSGAVGRPRRAVPSDREPALAPFLGAIEQDVGDRVTALASRAESGKRCIPNCLAGPDRSNLSQSDPLLVCHRDASPVCLLVAS